RREDERAGLGRDHLERAVAERAAGERLGGCVARLLEQQRAGQRRAVARSAADQEELARPVAERADERRGELLAAGEQPPQPLGGGADGARPWLARRRQRRAEQRRGGERRDVRLGRDDALVPGRQRQQEVGATAERARGVVGD